MKNYKIIKQFERKMYWSVERKMFYVDSPSVTKFNASQSIGYTPETQIPLNELSAALMEATKIAPCCIVDVWVGEEGGEA